MVLENWDIRGILKSMILDLENHEKLFNNRIFFSNFTIMFNSIYLNSMN